MSVKQAIEIRPKIVILGGGFAGLHAAKKLRRADAEVVIVDVNNYHLFQPLLYQVASAALSPGDIAHPIRASVSRQQNAQVIMAKAQAIDRANRRLILETGEITYDYLIVCTGLVNNYYGHEDWAEFAPGLKSLPDALTIRRRMLKAFETAENLAGKDADPAEIRSLLTFVVIGGGPTGVELAGALREIAGYMMINDFRLISTDQARVLLVEAGDRILQMFPERLANLALRALTSLGVEVRLNCRVEEIDALGVRACGELIPAKNVFWTAGIKATPIGRTLGAELDRFGRVPVNPDLTLPGDDRVYVIGDLAKFEHYGQPELPMLAPVATQMGRRAARNIIRRLKGKTASDFHYFDHGTMATIGRNRAIVDVFGLRFSGRIAWMAWLFVHILVLIGFRNRLSVMLQWAYTYFSKRRSARLIVP